MLLNARAAVWAVAMRLAYGPLTVMVPCLSCDQIGRAHSGSHFSKIRAQFPSLCQDAAGCMQILMWHKEKGMLAIALLQKTQTRTQLCPYEPGWLNGPDEFLAKGPGVA